MEKIALARCYDVAVINESITFGLLTADNFICPLINLATIYTIIEQSKQLVTPQSTVMSRVYFPFHAAGTYACSLDRGNPLLTLVPGNPFSKEIAKA